MSFTSSGLADLAAARDELVDALGALPEEALERRVHWSVGAIQLDWLVFMLGGHETEQRIGIEWTLGYADWQCPRAMWHLAGAPIARARLESLLVGVPESLVDRAPDPQEWSLRQMFEHVTSTNWRYSLQTQYAASRADGDPLRPDDATLPPRVPPPVHGEAMLALEDAQLVRPTDWAGSQQTVAFRLHRFAEHYEEHAADAEATLGRLGFARSRPARVGAARAAQLGELESTLLGVPPGLRDWRPPRGGSTIDERIRQLAEVDRGLLRVIREVGA